MFVDREKPIFFVINFQLCTSHKFIIFTCTKTPRPLRRRTIYSKIQPCQESMQVRFNQNNSEKVALFIPCAIHVEYSILITLFWRTTKIRLKIIIWPFTLLWRIPEHKLIKNTAKIHKLIKNTAKIRFISLFTDKSSTNDSVQYKSLRAKWVFFFQTHIAIRSTLASKTASEYYEYTNDQS